VLVESSRVLRRRRFHRQKLHLVLSGMRHLAAEHGDRATCLLTDTYREALARVGRPVVATNPPRTPRCASSSSSGRRGWSPRSCRTGTASCWPRTTGWRGRWRRCGGWRTWTRWEQESAREVF
jgi:hypothetical protein